MSDSVHQSSTLPVLDEGCLPPIPLLLRQLLQSFDAGTHSMTLQQIPAGNASLPACCELAGIDHLRLDREGLPGVWTWAMGNHRVAVTNRCGDRRRTDGLDHEGDLPADPAGAPTKRDRLLRDLVDLARLQDATAVLTDGKGADWEGLIESLQDGTAVRPPPVATRAIGFEGRMRVWNPLPFPRRLLASLPPDGESPPWAVVDERNGKHPLQVVTGATGTEWLTELHLGPFECVKLTPWNDPVSVSHWEVSEKVLDNGRVRAEFDQLGRVSRLCFDGIFTPLACPMVDPYVDGSPLEGDTRIQVLESGPTRGRVAVTIDSPKGTARLTYTLLINDDVLHIGATWHGAADTTMSLRHRLSVNEGQLACCGDGTPWIVPWQADLFSQEPALQPGLRWARLLGPGGSLGLIGPQPFRLRARYLSVEVSDSARYGLCDGVRQNDQLTLGRAALAAAHPGRHTSSGKARPPLFSLHDAPELLPLWCSPADGWKGELTLVDQSGKGGKALLRASGAQEARLVDMRGRGITDLEPRDGGFDIPYQPGSLLMVRWR